MGIIKNNRILKKGFTLIEMTLVVAVFSILIVVTAEVFISFYNISVKTAASRDLGQNLRYSMETISREIRNAEKLEPYVSDVTSYGADAASYVPSDWDEDLNAGDIKILTREGKSVLFYCEAGSGAKCSEDNPGSLWQKTDSDVAIEITPDNLSIIEYQILADGTVSEGNAFSIQPKVTIYVRAKSGIPDRAGDYPTISIKNTISKRNYNDLSYCSLQDCGDIVVSKLDAGLSHAMAIKTNSEVWGWGRCIEGSNASCTQSNNGERAKPMLAGGVGSARLDEVADVTSGNRHTVILKKDGTVWAWGDNWTGALGDGKPIPSSLSSSIPIQVVGPNNVGYLQNIIKIAAGYNYTIALRGDGTVWRWGANVSSYPQQVSISGTIEDIDVSLSSSCCTANAFAVTNQGYVYRWYNFGTATSVSGLSDVASVSVFNSLKRDGTVWSFSGSSPVQVMINSTTPLNRIISISSGLNHTLALREDGTVWAWGGNSYRQCGVGSTSSSVSNPMQVKTSSTVFLENITNISAGGEFSLAIRSDGSVFAWGRGTDYRLGNNSTATQLYPINVQSGVEPLGSFFIDR
jgi:prepilin-type N-terminal cleavage/methylation domain-containing protein